MQEDITILDQRLTNTLVKVRRRIQQIRNRAENIGEQNTKATLIDPLLSALGWDLEEIDEVCREYRRKPQDNPVDYALFILRTPRLFVEAKGLEKDLNDRKWISQILGYATVVGVQWCILTNGDEYRIYNAHAPVDVEEKLFRVVRISNSTQDEYTLDTLGLLSKDKMGEHLLNVHWKAYFIDRHVKTALTDLLKREDQGLVRLIRKQTPSLSPLEIRESLKRADIQIDFPVVSNITQSPAATLNNPGVRESTPKIPGTIKTVGVQVSDLIRAGSINPPMEVERTYKGVHLKATIQSDGTIMYAGRVYMSLSTAAGMARMSVIGSPPDRPYPQTNGWTFWQYHDSETGALQEIDLLRQRYLRTRRED